MQVPVKFNIVLWLLASVLTSTGCSTNANYLPASGAFGTVVRLDGNATVTRDCASQDLQVSTEIFVGDAVHTDANTRLQINLVPGQYITLLPGTRWTIESVVTNGAVYDSITHLTRGALYMQGEVYLPHRMKVKLPAAELITLSENYFVDSGNQPGSEAVVVALGSTPVTVSNRHGTVTLSTRFEAATAGANAAPAVAQTWTGEKLNAFLGKE